MTNKKRRRRPPPRTGGSSTSAGRGRTTSDGPAASRTAPSRAGAKPARREHKEEARQAREAARKRAARTAAYSYSQHPPTSGYHDPVPLPIPSDHVFTEPVQETHAVHNIEHGEIFIYYRDQGDGTLPPDVVAALKKVVGLPSNKNTLLAPYRDFSDPKTALAFTAWNKLQTCPGTITAAQATSVAYGFEYAFACTGNAPEPKASGNDC